MQDEKALALFHEIQARTHEGRIPWEPAVYGSDLLAAIKGKYSLVLKAYTSEGWPSLVMRDAADRELLTVTTELEGIEPQALQDLYENARRQALKVDAQVQDLLADLKSL